MVSHIIEFHCDQLDHLSLYQARSEESIDEVQRAIAIDLDGTLLDSQRTIGPQSLEMIAEVKQRGWPIILSTARPVRAIKQAVPTCFSEFYWAACNGAWVLRDEQVLTRTEMTRQSVLYWIEALCERGLHFFIEAGDKLFSDQPMLDDFVGECHRLDQWRKGGACKVLVSARSRAEVDIVGNLVPAECAYVVTDDGKLVQIAHRACNKLSAVRYVLRREHMALHQVIAFGDDNNDIPLVREAGCGVAMGNATAALKEVADHITLTSDEDGVGVFLAAVLSGDNGSANCAPAGRAKPT
jgi:Cof subfamily protein (haloacid dehalogenase superfamily)